MIMMVVTVLVMMVLAMMMTATMAAWGQAATTAAWGKEPMKLSSTGPSSTLPDFFFMAKGEEGGDNLGPCKPSCI